MFTRKHFELVAQILRSSVSGDDSENMAMVRDRIAEDFAEAFAQSNPNFNRAKFLAACKESKS